MCNQSVGTQAAEGGEGSSSVGQLMFSWQLAKSQSESGSLLHKNFKLLCKFHLHCLSPVSVRSSECSLWLHCGRGCAGGVGWERHKPISRLHTLARTKAPANAIIQVAAAISCLISIINTRHRHSIADSSSQSNNGHKSFHMPSVWSLIPKCCTPLPDRRPRHWFGLWSDSRKPAGSLKIRLQKCNILF